MSGLRIEIDLDKIGGNARRIVDDAARRDISITGVTKALLGEPLLARTLVEAGVVALGDSRVENIERMRLAEVTTSTVLIRSPLPSQIDRVVRAATISLASDLDVLTALSDAARACGRIHHVVVMVELGDLREGVMSNELAGVVRHVAQQPSLRLHGIGTNLACRNGVEPTDDNMGRLSLLVETVECQIGRPVACVSGGNSANLAWMTDTASVGRVNNLRVGESILLGRNPLDHQQIDGLHTDAITIVGEVIESHRKPVRAWGRSGRNAFGECFDDGSEIRADGAHESWQTIVAAGRQDVDPTDLACTDDVVVLGASSDHLIVQSAGRCRAGQFLRFEPGYSSLLRAMTSPFVGKRYLSAASTAATSTTSDIRPD